MSLAELQTDVARRPGGRVPPQNIDAEESVLGAMLLSGDAIGAAVERLAADHFYVPANGLVFEAIESLYVTSEPVDCLTVADQLERTGNLAAAGGPSACWHSKPPRRRSPTSTVTRGSWRTTRCYGA